MNKTEAAYVISLLSWMLDQPVNDRRMTYEDARWHAANLAERARAHAALGGSTLTPAAVDNWFIDHQPRVAPSTAYVLLLDTGEVRKHFAGRECVCQVTRRRLCTFCQLGKLTDDQLNDAARWVASHDCPLAEGISDTYDEIVAQAYDAARKTADPDSEGLNR